MKTKLATTSLAQSLTIIACLLGWLAFAVADVRAAGAPSATTLAASGITPTSAVVSGRFTANGANTDVVVELSDNGAAADDFTCCTLEGGFVDFVVPMTLTGLKAGHTYTYRLKATNPYGTSAGAYLEFTTPATAPEVTTIAPINVTATSARFQANMKANGEFSAYLFQWGTSTNAADYNNVVNPGFLGPFFDSTQFYDVSGLQPNTVYFYRGIAGNSHGNAYGNDFSFRTAGPPIVNTLAAQNISVNSATLRGTVTPNSLNTSYYFQFGTTTSYGTTLGAGSVSAGLGTNTVTFNATGLIPLQTYHYRLVANNSMGQVFGPDMSFTTPTWAPAIATTAATEVTASSAKMNGTVTTAGESALVWFEIGTTTNYGVRNPGNIVAAYASGSANNVVNGLARGTTYHYRFVGSNSFGVVYGSDIAFTTVSMNDHCSEALVINSVPFTHTQSTGDATSDGDPALHCGLTDGGKGVWFKISVNSSGFLTVDTLGSSFDTMIEIYSGACGTLTSIACNDDASGTRASSNQVFITAGSYYILAGGWQSATGSLTLHASFLPTHAPTATDIVASDIAPHNAVLRANINPGNLPTKTWFIYGLERNLAAVAAEQLNTSGQPYAFSAALNHLLPGTTYQYYLAASNSIGWFVGEWQSFTTAADSSRIDVTVPGDLISATSINSPTNQTAPEAIDNDVTSKYLNFNKVNAGFTVTPSGSRAVRALTVISADDFPDRDPSSFVIEGSDDGVNFSRIASNAVPAFATRHSIQSFALPGTNEFNLYRVLFPTVANAFTANSMQVAEVELLQYAEITSPNDTISITLPTLAADVRGVRALFDRQLDDTNKLEIAPVFAGSTIVNIIPAAGPTVLKGFELIGAADDVLYPQRRSINVIVAGSNDGTNYTTLATVTPAAPSSNMQIQEFSTLTNNTAWTHYRVTFGPPVSGDRIQVGEMRLFGESAPVPPALTIRPSGSNVLVSWPNAPGYQLESCTDMAQGNWSPVTTVPVLSNGVNTVTVPMSGAPIRFFQLRK